jgi:hypothetical protein
MYANLKVEARGETFAAWKVELSQGEATIHLDKNDGEEFGGSYPVEGGEITVDASDVELTISADF